MGRVCDTRWIAVCACAVLWSQPVAAQTVTAQGWPEAAPAAVAAPAAAVTTVKPAPKPAAPAKPAAAPSRPATVKPEVVVVKPAANVSPEVAAIATPVSPAPAATSLPELLQQQSALLSRLAEELDKQRSVIAEQQQQIKALEAGRAAATAAAATAASATPPPAKVAPPPALPALTVETGGIKLKLSGLFQGWYTATSGAAADTFRLRRTELKFSGDMSSRVKWALMVDPAKALSLANSTVVVAGQPVVTASSIGQSGRVLQDAFASLVVAPSLIVDVGQQKIPLSLEGMQSSGKLETIERALFMSDKARGGGYGDVRDLGLMVRGKVVGGTVDYFAGVFNGLGESQNDQDKNDVKELVARTIYRPTFIKGLQLGGSFARDGFRTLEALSRERHGVEALYSRGALGLKSELMFGRDAAVTRRGGYVQATRRLHKSVQAVFRFDSWDPDTRSDATLETVTERDWLGGVTYTIANSGAWLQFNYVRKTFADVAPARNLFMANVQSTW